MRRRQQLDVISLESWYTPWEHDSMIRSIVRDELHNTLNVIKWQGMNVAWSPPDFFSFGRRLAYSYCAYATYREQQPSMSHERCTTGARPAPVVRPIMNSPPQIKYVGSSRGDVTHCTKLNSYIHSNILSWTPSKGEELNCQSTHGQLRLPTINTGHATWQNKFIHDTSLLAYSLASISYCGGR